MNRHLALAFAVLGWTGYAIGRRVTGWALRRLLDGGEW